MYSKKILITGINGFVGSKAAEYFAGEFSIFGLDMFGTRDNNFIQGEVDVNNLKKFNQKFDYIFHFAGSGTVSMAQKNPEVEYTKSVLSIKHLLDFCVENNPQAKIIFSSSAAVYGDKYNSPIKENFELNPISIYGKHKVEAERLLSEYWKKYGIRSNIVRFFSIYGEGLRKQLLWDFCNRLKNLEGNTINCFGTGEEKRDFIHINDALLFIKLLMDNDVDFGVYNCGAGSEITIETVLGLLCKIFGVDCVRQYDNITRAGDPAYLCADMSLAEDLGFKHKIKIEQGLEQYVKWFKNN